MNNEYDYVPTDTLPNIVEQVEKGGAARQSKSWWFLDELVLPLAKANPSWTFVGREVRNKTVGGGVITCITRYDVMCRGERLGYFTYDNGRNGAVYGIDNERLRKERTRGSMTKTSDAKKAKKIIEKYFFASTIEEAGAAAASKVYGTVHTLFNQINSERSDAIYKLNNPMAEFVIQNLEAFLDSAALTPQQKTAAEQLGMRHNQRDTALRLRLAHQDNKGVTVTLRDGQHIVITNYSASLGMKEISVVSVYDMPPVMKRNLTMLKLNPIGTYIEDIGIRVDENTYFVITEEPE
jgi:hypothetical protein